MTQHMTREREARTIAAAGLGVRVNQAGAAPKIEGYAAIFNAPSEIITDSAGTYRETIKPGAFAAALRSGADVRALLNHDPNFVLGRSKAGTLRLKEDGKGLWYSVTPPDTQWARDLLASMRRGDIDQSSFAFRVIKDEWRTGRTADGKPLDERTIVEARLLDVSPVTYPAYQQTSSAVRSDGWLAAAPARYSPTDWRATQRQMQDELDELKAWGARHSPRRDHWRVDRKTGQIYKEVVPTKTTWYFPRTR